MQRGAANFLGGLSINSCAVNCTIHLISSRPVNGLLKSSEHLDSRSIPPPSKPMRASQALLWRLRIGKSNPYSTRTLAKLYERCGFSAKRACLVKGGD